MKRFTSRILICAIPVLVSALLVAQAWTRYQRGEGGFKLGVDLVGGTILVYEVSDPNTLPEGYRKEELAASLKRRIDPTDLYNVTIRPVGDTRVEIILPTGGAGGAKRAATAEEVERIKSLIAQVGSLEFRILANQRDDTDAIKIAEDYIADPKNKEMLDKLAREGKVPPPPPPPEGGAFETAKGRLTYSWAELGKQERHDLGLDNAAENDTEPERGTGAPRNVFWKSVADARANYKCVVLPQFGGALLFSRKCDDLKIRPEDREQKKYEYFVLTRDPERDPVTGEPKAITGQYLVNAGLTTDNQLKPAVSFRFNTRGGDLFYDVTSKNAPEGSRGTEFKRHLAILLDGKIISAPSLNQPIRTDGMISGSFTVKDVQRMVTILRSGALPATLKAQPVSENSMGATLGDDTIRSGTLSVGMAFVAVLIFMVLYYRFAGVVACVALLANLLLTVAFMVAVNATFTLPGLAGLVLMLALAVDANVLIYERLREERERGASLALALRNGYDRALPTIIDTHLTSIFTAIVLYAVGNDQLKGFGISLTVGLIISLFTSLYMTRLMFDIWQHQGWLKKLSMYKMFERPNWDFMAIRNYWFTATILLTLFGITVFLLRGEASLNIDFTGGTAYGGQLAEQIEISELRAALNEQRQDQQLRVQSVKPLSDDNRSFEITYADNVVRKIELPNPATPDEVKARASHLPDLSIEQIRVGNPELTQGDKSALFNLRTSEKAPDLVQASVDRLLGDKLRKIELKSFEIGKDNKTATLTFADPKLPDKKVHASPSQVGMLLEKEFKAQGLPAFASQFALEGQGEAQEGRYQILVLNLTEPLEKAKLEGVLKAVQTEFAARPRPERLENFDSQLAAETQLRALYAVLASWGAILLYLWFRFGNWTFGLAAVLCLVHDLLFTLGVIAFCHYIHHGMPFLAHLLGLADFKIDLPSVAALLTLVGYSVNDTIVVFDRIREVRGKNPLLTYGMINDSVNQTLSRTLLTSFITWLTVLVLYIWGGEGVHLFAFVMVVGVIVGTYSSIYIASPLLLIFGEGTPHSGSREREAQKALAR